MELPEGLRDYAVGLACQKGARRGSAHMDPEDIAHEAFIRVLDNLDPVYEKNGVYDAPLLFSLVKRAVVWIIIDRQQRKSVPVSYDPELMDQLFESGVTVEVREKVLDFNTFLRTLANRVRIVSMEAAKILENWIEPCGLAEACHIMELNQMAEAGETIRDSDLEVKPRHIREALGLGKGRYHELAHVIHDCANSCRR